MTVTAFENCRIFDGHGVKLGLGSDLLADAGNIPIIMKAGEFVRRAGL